MDSKHMQILYFMKYGLLSAMLVVLASGNLSAQIQLTFTINQPTCNGYTDGSATVNASGGNTPYSYLWNNNQTGQTNFGLGAGTVVVTVTDQSGQTATGSVVITQPDPVKVDFSADGLSCNDLNGTLTAVPSGGTSPYAYAWANGETTQTIDISAAGTYFVTVTDANNCSAVNAYFVAQAPEFFPSYTLTQPLCNGQANGAIGIAVYGTNPPFTWVWSNGVQNLALANIPAGDYGITITDGLGCTFTDTVQLTVLNPMSVEVHANDIPCFYLPTGGSVNSIVTGGTPPYTFVWSNGSNDPGQQNLPAGVYEVTVYDIYGCTATDVDTVHIPDTLSSVIVSLSPACGGNNGCITVQGVGGTPPYTYVWPTLGQTGPTVCGLAPGSYYVCVFDANHCQRDMVVDIDSIDVLGVTFNLTNAECPGINNGTVTAIVDPPTGVYNYQWQPQPQPNAPQIDSLAAGTIVSVTITDANTGCVGMLTDTIGAATEITLNTITTNVTCPDDLTGNAKVTASGGTAPYVFTWTLPDSSKIVGPNIGPLGVGTYPVSVVDAKGCTGASAASVNALSDPVADYEIVTLDCKSTGITVQFNDQSTDSLSSIVSWNWNIAWGNNSTTSTEQNPPALQFVQDQTGTVQLTVTSALGCVATVSAPFEIAGIPSVSVCVPYSTVDCKNGPIPITVTGAPNNTYQWIPTTGLTFNPDALNVIADPSETQEYQLVVTNGSCSDTVDVKIVRVEPIDLTVQDSSVITCDTLAPLQASVNPAANVTYVWTDANGNTVGATPSITVPAHGLQTFTVVATDIYGCTESANAEVAGNSVDVDAPFDSLTAACENVPGTFSAVNLDPSDIVTYQWSSTDPNVVILPNNAATVTVTSPAGSYTLTLVVRNQHGCERTYTTEVTSTPTVSLEGAVDIDLCQGKIVGFTNGVNVSGTWDFGDNNTSTEANPTHTYAQEGVYTVSFSSTEICVLPFDTTITVLPEAAVQAAIANTYQSCTNQARIQFSDQSTHVYPLTGWNWSFSTVPPQTANVQNPLVTFSAEGTITATLTVTDANGCTGTASAQVDVQVVNDSIASEEIFCPGTSVPLNPDFNPDYNYDWVSTPNDPAFDPNSPNPSVMPAVRTVYVATIINGPCAVVDSITVTPEPAATVALPQDTLLCSDAAFTITPQSTNGVTFVWSESPDFTPPLPSSGNSVVIVPEKNGIYYVQATNANGCTAVDSIRINNARVEIDPQPVDQDICAGQSAELSLTNLDPEDNLTYIWSPALDPVPNQTVTPAATTTYSVQAVNQFGCRDTADFTVNVITIAVTADVIGKDTVCPGQSTELLATVTSNTSNITYSWTPSNSLTNPNTANPTAEPMETTVYTVEALAEGLCPDTANVTVYFMSGECAPPYIFVPKAFTPNSDGNNDFFIVRGLDIAEVYFVVWDRWGEKVYETSDPEAQGWDGTFNGKDLTPDSYAWYLQVTCGNGEIYKEKGDVTLLK